VFVLFRRIEEVVQTGCVLSTDPTLGRSDEVRRLSYVKFKVWFWAGDYNRRGEADRPECNAFAGGPLNARKRKLYSKLHLHSIHTLQNHVSQRRSLGDKSQPQKQGEE